MTESNIVLTLTKVCKNFGSVKALHNVDLSLRKGEVLALIGENGAGKSTLVKILTGIHQPSSGNFTLKDEEVFFKDAKDAINSKISAIHQETIMFDNLSVAENIFIGMQLTNKVGLLDWDKMEEKAETLLEYLSASDVDVSAPLNELSIAKQHIVSVARALVSDSDIMVFDEPTASLSKQETNELLEIITKLKEEGKAILFISHKLDEVFEIADRYTVFRDGAYIEDGLIEDVNEQYLIKMMVGQEIKNLYPDRDTKIKDKILEVKNLNKKNVFKDISFDLKEGEILGFYGLVGAGRTEVMNAIYGVDKASSGEIYISGEKVNITEVAYAQKLGFACVPENRQKEGGILDFTIKENISLSTLSQTNKFFIDSKSEEDLADFYIEKLNIKVSSRNQLLGELSGGNQQKVVIAKALACNPKIIIIDEPTKGIDIGSKQLVHKLINNLTKEGLSVIMVTSEIDEVLGMADRIVVMRDGSIVDIVKKDSCSKEELLSKALGV